MRLTFAPEVLLFKRFQAQWYFIDIQKYETGIGDVAGLVAVVRGSTITFCYKNLQKSKPRDDYREFLEFVLAFLGAIPKREVRFMSPCIMHFGCPR